MRISWRFSLIEQIVNTSLGLVFGALFLIFFINPLFGLSLSVISSLEVSTIMFLVSIVRGFIIRRVWIRFVELEQSFKHSFVEKFIDVGIGLVVATIVWSFIVMPSYDVKNPFMIDFLINFLFFIINLLRAIVVRRWFENYSQKSLTETFDSV